MKVELEKYRDYTIFYETMYDRIEIEGLEGDTDRDASSLKQAKKIIDEHLQDVNKFEAFKIMPNPKSRHYLGGSLKGTTEVVAVRKDKKFTIVTSEGKRKCLGEYDERYYVIHKKENEPILEKIKKRKATLVKISEEMKQEISKLEGELILETLQAYKKELFNKLGI